MGAHKKRLKSVAHRMRLERGVRRMRFKMDALQNEA